MTFMFLALAQLTNKAFTDAGKGRIRQSLTALVYVRYQIVYSNLVILTEPLKKYDHQGFQSNKYVYVYLLICATI